MSSAIKRIGGSRKTVDGSGKHDSNRSEMSRESNQGPESTHSGNTPILKDNPNREDSADSDEHEYKRKLDEQHTEKNHKAQNDRRGISEPEDGSVLDSGEKHYDGQEKDAGGSFVQLPEIAESSSRMSIGSDGETNGLKLGDKKVSTNTYYCAICIACMSQLSVTSLDGANK